MRNLETDTIQPSNLSLSPVYPLAQFTTVANVQFPSIYASFLRYVKVVQLDFAWCKTLGCHLEMNFYHRLIAITLLPFLVLAFLGTTYTIASRKHRHNGHHLVTIRRRDLGALLVVTFLIDSTTSSLIFQTFVCDAVEDGGWYLRADYSLQCYVAGQSERHTHGLFLIYASIMILVYPLGIPALYALLLFRRERRGHGMLGERRFKAAKIAPCHRARELEVNGEEARRIRA